MKDFNLTTAKVLSRGPISEVLHMKKINKAEQLSFLQRKTCS